MKVYLFDQAYWFHEWYHHYFCTGLWPWVEAWYRPSSIHESIQWLGRSHPSSCSWWKYNQSYEMVDNTHMLKCWNPWLSWWRRSVKLVLSWYFWISNADCFASQSRSSTKEWNRLRVHKKGIQLHTKSLLIYKNGVSFIKHRNWMWGV